MTQNQTQTQDQINNQTNGMNMMGDGMNQNDNAINQSVVNDQNQDTVVYDDIAPTRKVLEFAEQERKRQEEEELVRQQE